MATLEQIHDLLLKVWKYLPVTGAPGSPWTDREKDEVFDRIKIIDQVTFEDAFQEVLGQKADFGGMRKIVVTKDDIPDHKFFNAFERAILSPLFEFDDLKGVV